MGNKCFFANVPKMPIVLTFGLLARINVQDCTKAKTFFLFCKKCNKNHNCSTIETVGLTFVHYLMISQKRNCDFDGLGSSRVPYLGTFQPLKISTQ